VTGGESAGLEEGPACASRAGKVIAGFDARERVTSAAYELHCRAAADSAVYGHPGFVPGRFAAGHGAAAEVAELCATGVWEPVVGGYRILDQFSGGVSVDALVPDHPAEQARATT
jgi:hypothetical protein